MYFKCKINNDQSHWYAIIPHKNVRAFHPKVKDQEYNVLADGSFVLRKDDSDDSVEIVRVTTRKEEFDSAYESTRGMVAEERDEHLKSSVRPFFKSDAEAEAYVSTKLSNKRRAQLSRSIRFRRKAILNRFDFFCTFTYDDAKVSSYEQFDHEIRVFFNNMSCRSGWKVMFVPEFGKETNRFHIHALIAVPDPYSIPGKFELERVYNKKQHRMKYSVYNSYFRERWGRNDWQCLNEMSPSERKASVAYIIKYLTKTDARAFYSRGIPTFLQADIMMKDVIDFLYEKDNTVILHDDFHVYACYRDQGVINDDHIRRFAITG